MALGRAGHCRFGRVAVLLLHAVKNGGLLINRVSFQFLSMLVHKNTSEAPIA